MKFYQLIPSLSPMCTGLHKSRHQPFGANRRGWMGGCVCGRTRTDNRESAPPPSPHDTRRHEAKGLRREWRVSERLWFYAHFLFMVRGLLLPGFCHSSLLSTLTWRVSSWWYSTETEKGGLKENLPFSHRLMSLAAVDAASAGSPGWSVKDFFFWLVTVTMS